ncbi:hypothetical protein [Photobacterium profundum]|uniref:Uncharacterized protein n=1 Tax=Photobacterium profundum (strain SS9) TaxID=298386 RepID=Q6LFV9_PHOPR|nr:hypothetical protein [Photobacterium profundum]CAG23821.1 hypothetical protein PBPRB1976 [Photobacterium profundum SS9]
MKRKYLVRFSALSLLALASSAHAERATISFDRIKNNYAYFSNQQQFLTPDNGSYAYVPYFNEGWRVISEGNSQRLAAYIISVGKGGWTSVNYNGFVF